jgi:hypothetical protein
MDEKLFYIKSYNLCDIESAMMHNWSKMCKRAQSDIQILKKCHFKENNLYWRHIIFRV